MGKIWGLLLALALFITAGCGSVQVPALGKSDEDLGVSQLRQIVGRGGEQRRLMWQAEGPGPYKLELRLEGKSQLLEAKDVGFTVGENKYNQYTVYLQALEPKKEYAYRIVLDKDKGPWHKLKTEGDSFKALMFPDSQSSDYSGWQQLAQEAFKRHSEAEVFISMGDLVDNGEDGYQWRQWFKGIEGPAADRAFAPVIGNHEAYSKQWQYCLPATYTNLFHTPDNGYEDYRHQFYSFDYGPVHFAVLDTNYNEETMYLQPGLRRAQLNWLHEDLSLSRAKWKIVLMHRDIVIYEFGPESGRAPGGTWITDQGWELMEIFDTYKVDAVLSAHLHTYRRRKPFRNFAPNPKGTQYILTGVAGSVRYPKLWGSWEHDVARAPQPETANYMLLEASSRELKLQAMLPDGTVFDQLQLQK